MLPLPLADAGTPLMWASALHLLFGNLIIGIGEGVLIARLFRISTRRAVFWMIPANYVSMIAGACFFSSVLAYRVGQWYLGSVPIDRIGSLVFASILFSYALSVLLEWPFVIGALWKKTRSPFRTLLASIAAQTASYLVLALWYYPASNLSLITQPTLTTDHSVIRNPQAILYYIDPDDHLIYESALDATSRRSLGSVSDSDEYLGLVAGEKDLNLCVISTRQSDRVLVPAITAIPADFDRSMAWPHVYPFGAASDLRRSANTGWQARTGYWLYGLIAHNSDTGEQVQLALDTPFISWSATNATILPGDQIIFELEYQILLFDLPTRRLLYLTRGTSPVVILNPAQTIPSTTTAPTSQKEQ